MTATIIEQEVDTESIFLLDFNHAPQCEIEEHMGADECEHPAEYKLVLSCCADMWLVCEDHMLLLMNEMKKFRMPQHDPEWGGCGGAPVHFTIIERL